MSRSLFVFTILCLGFTTLAFLGGEPSSARGFYYIFWLSLVYFLIWKRRDHLISFLTNIPIPKGLLFIGLGVLMIFLEETIAGITVNILRTENLAALIASVPQYYANNLLLLPGFIIAWYILLSRYQYSQKEFFLLVGLFGIFAEKIYLHIITIPILGIPLVPITMFTYIGIILPSYLSLGIQGEKVIPRWQKYLFGCIFPIIVSLPFLLIHSYLTSLGIVDPTVLKH